MFMDELSDKTGKPRIRICSAADVPPSFFETRRFSGNTQTVSEILDKVRTEGDAALHFYASRFDRADPASFRILPEELKDAELYLKEQDSALYDALCYSRDLALRFAGHQRRCFTDFEEELVPGLFAGQKTIPVDCAGVYVPAGRFPLLSSVVMGTSPAKAAGVKRIVLCTPPRPHPSPYGGRPWADARILAAASLCGVDEVYAAGGAQAVAAMAYGTESIPRCDVIVGPGNRYVAEAKRLVYGEVGIDMLAGPTEVLVISDGSARPEWVAADMIAQAEHDADAQAVLVTTSRRFAENVCAELERQLASLGTAETAAASLASNGCIIIADDMEQAAAIADRKAPEHLELAFDDGPLLRKVAETVHNYGSLFIGHEAAEVLGDYAAGLNHTLPTSGSARFTGGLSVRHFLKTATTLRTGNEAADGVRTSARAACVLGKAEGLEGHAAAAFRRLEDC